MAQSISPNRLRSTAFTLIELLVVVAIIAILMSILLPSLSRARQQARDTACMSNMREWGKGLLMFAFENRDLIPWDGPNSDNPGLPAEDDPSFTPAYKVSYFYPNAIPPYVGQETYRHIMESSAALDMPKNVPLPGQHSMFVCPSAQPVTSDDFPSAIPYEVDFSSPQLYFYFNYVINSKLENGSPYTWDNGAEQIRLNQIRDTVHTVVLIDMLSTKSEFPLSTRPPQGINLRRTKGKWAELAYRHRKGSFVLMADSHVAHVDYAYANEREDEDYIVRTKAGYNKVDLIWSPLTDAN